MIQNTRYADKLCSITKQNLQWRE